MTLRMRVLPRFPAKITGTAGIQTMRDGPDIVIKSDYGSLVRIPAVDNEATAYFKVWNSDLNAYSIMTFEDVITAIGSLTGFLDAPTYDPQNKRTDIFARFDSFVWEKIGDYSPVAAASLIVTGLSAYKRLRITGFLYPSVASGLGIQFSANNRSSFDVGANYDLQSINTAGTVSAAISSNGKTSGSISGDSNVGANVLNGVEFEVLIDDFNKPARTKCRVSSFFELSVLSTANGGFRNIQSVAYNSFRIISGGGNITGSVLVEGARG